LLGPVFERELTTTARSARAFAMRSVYAAAVLAVVAAGPRDAPGVNPAARLTGLAGEVFWHLVLAQGAAVLLLTPALVAGAIAVEVERKTLHDLLTSTLTSAEIVVGKMAARLLHVAVLVAAGLPILLAAGLLGGIDVRLVGLSVAATLTTAFFLAGLAVFASTQARTVRGALNLAFTLTMIWLVLPAAVDFHLPRFGTAGQRLQEWVAPVNAWVAPASPFALLMEWLRGAPLRDAALVRRVAAMAGLQVVSGAALTALAVVRLRPAYSAHRGGGRRAAGRSAGWRRRRPCGDHPMIWKELFATPAPVLGRHFGLSVALVLGGVLTWGATDFGLPAFREVLAVGYGVAPPGSARGLFHLYLRVVATGAALTFLLGIAGDAAAGMTCERERDTWVSLVATPLTGGEIVGAKMLGAVWGVRHAAAVAGLLAFAGVLAGSVHPAGLALAAAELAAYAAFAAALGTWVSLRAAGTMRALTATLAGLLLAAAGPALVLAALWRARPLALAGCAPVMLAALLASPADVLGRRVENAFGAVSDAPFAALWANHGPEMWLAGLAGVTAYAAGAWALTWSACRGFDARLDRPPVVRVAGTGPVGKVRPARRRPKRTAGASKGSRSRSS